MRIIHATTIAIEGQGVMLRGSSGAGKSDLALRLIEGGAELVADDRTMLTVADGTLIASAPNELRGLLEVRGVGILTLPYRTDIPVTLIVDLEGSVARLPEPDREEFDGIRLSRLTLAPFEASTPAKLHMALRHGIGIAP